jgi:tRNA-2-methylthio-N6-dimethylallyladenosine synthase
LSKDETYGDISVRLMMAFAFPSRAVVTICVLLCGPFTRGRERSREPQSIMKEIQDLWDKGSKKSHFLDKM